ncbi:MAG: hypothetical protein AAGF93_16845 [Cyanobacteria bacterium P01_H01_bin.105]
MLPSIGHRTSLIAQARCLAGKVNQKLTQPMVIGLAILVLATGMGNGLPQDSTMTAEPAQYDHQPANHQPTHPTSPLWLQANERLSHRRMTSALMTNHSLTSAYFFSRHHADKLPTDTPVKHLNGNRD